MENPCGWKFNLVHKHGNESLERNEIVCKKQACYWVRCLNALSQEFQTGSSVCTTQLQVDPSGCLSVCLLANLTLTRNPAATGQNLWLNTQHSFWFSTDLLNTQMEKCK